MRKILENLLDDYMRLAEMGNRKDIKITIDTALSAILKLTNLKPNLLLEQSGFTLVEFKSFTSHMARTLLKHSAKGRSWETCEHSYLVQKLLDEVNEYIKGHHDKEELIDIANMCLMLYLREDL